MIFFILVSTLPIQAQTKVRNGKMAVTSAKVRLKYKKYDEALEILEEGRKIDPDHAPLYPLLGSLYIKNKDYVKADSCLDIAVSLNSKFKKEVEEIRLEEWAKLVNIGAKALKGEDFDTAIKVLTAATILHSRGVEAYINLAASFTNYGQHRKAIDPFLTSIALDPENVDIKLDLARVYGFLGHPDSSKIYYKQAIQAQPENISIKEGLAECYLREGSLDSASTLYSELMKQEEVNPNVAFNAALVEFQRENWEGAEQAFIVVIEADPEDIEALANLSVSMMQQNKYKEVIPYLEKIVDMDGDNKEAWGSLVVAYAQVGMNDKASMAHKKYQELGGD
jgi:tetratricopeptide (TPR) repeat protein